MNKPAYFLGEVPISYLFEIGKHFLDLERRPHVIVLLFNLAHKIDQERDAHEPSLPPSGKIMLYDRAIGLCYLLMNIREECEGEVILVSEPLVAWYIVRTHSKHAHTETLEF